MGRLQRSCVRRKTGIFSYREGSRIAPNLLARCRQTAATVVYVRGWRPRSASSRATTSQALVPPDASFRVADIPQDRPQLIAAQITRSRLNILGRPGFRGGVIAPRIASAARSSTPSSVSPRAKSSAASAQQSASPSRAPFTMAAVVAARVRIVPPIPFKATTAGKAPVALRSARKYALWPSMNAAIARGPFSASMASSTRRLVSSTTRQARSLAGRIGTTLHSPLRSSSR